MCYEDIELGYRRRAVYTPIFPSGSINANRSRVLIRMSINATIANDGNAFGRPEGSPSGNQGVMFVNSGNPIDEMRFEEHGSLVTGAWTFSTSQALIVTEIIDDDLPNRLSKMGVKLGEADPSRGASIP